MNPIRPGTHKYPTGQRVNVALAFEYNKNAWQRSARKIKDLISRLPYEKQNVPKDAAPKVKKSDKRTLKLTNSAYVWNSAKVIDPGLRYGNTEELKRQLDNIIVAECDMFDQLATNAVKYRYEVSPELMDLTMESIYNMLEDDLLNGSDFWTWRFWMNDHISDAMLDGVTDSIDSAINIAQGTPVEGELAILDAEERLTQQPYRNRLRLVHGRVFEQMKGLTGEMKSQLRFTLTEGMARGLNIRDLTGMINKRLAIGMVRAERIARTEINHAYRAAYLNESTNINQNELKDSDFVIMQAHRSALSPTTRDPHAKRHGTIHTAEAQAEWWATDSNEINCLCSTLDVLVNKKTGKVLQSKMIEKMLEQKETWFKLAPVEH